MHESSQLLLFYRREAHKISSQGSGGGIHQKVIHVLYLSGVAPARLIKVSSSSPQLNFVEVCRWMINHEWSLHPLGILQLGVLELHPLVASHALDFMVISLLHVEVGEENLHLCLVIKKEHPSET